MTVIDINLYKQEREEALNNALDAPEDLFELHEINAALEDEEEWMEYARQVLYPPLRCIRGGRARIC